MLRSVSIELMWADRPYPERATAAAEAGFDLVDLWDSRTSDVEGVAAACRAGGISGSMAFSVTVIIHFATRRSAARCETRSAGLSTRR